MQSFKLFRTSRLAGGFRLYKKRPQLLLRTLSLLHGAEGETRTPTPLRELDPEPSVSTNFTTSAQECE